MSRKPIRMVEVGKVRSALGNMLPVTVWDVERGASAPDWFRTFMRYKCPFADDPWEPFDKFHCTDHTGRLGPYVTLEPYETAMNTSDWRGLLALCEDIGLEIKISPSSPHFPCSTILIVIWPKGKPYLSCATGEATWDGKLTTEDRAKLRKDKREAEKQFWKMKEMVQAGK